MADSKYKPPGKEEVILELRPWIQGFVLKEYRTHVDPNDQADLVQEGCLSLIQIVTKLEEQPLRFTSKDEYIFYVKAVVRNSIRDYILRLRSKFGISLYKLRRRQADQTIGDFMNNVGDEYAYVQEEEADDPGEWLTRQCRLSLLSRVTKNGRGMDIDDCQVILVDVIKEYKRFLIEEGRWKYNQPSPRMPDVGIEQIQTPAETLPHSRTPLASTAIPATRTVKCASHFCEVDLRTVKMPIVHRGYGYCSKTCRKEWPPIIIRLQTQYDAPIEVILEVSLKLFKSKRRTAEILGLASSTMERLMGNFEIEENE